MRIIHPLFRIDLSNADLSLSEENPWYNAEFFLNYSYPVTTPLTPDLDRALGNVSSDHSRDHITILNVTFENEGVLEDAIFELDEIVGELVSFTFRYGLGGLPLFDRKLATLKFPVFEFPENDIYLHASGIITQSYPAVGYNFPQVIVDAFDNEDQFELFEGKINNYIDGAFIENSFNAQDDVNENRNIMQPMPYVLTVLQQIATDAGLTLEGDILNDPDLLQATINMVSGYYSTSSNIDENITIQASDYEFLVDAGAIYDKSLVLQEEGRFFISASLNLRTRNAAGIRILVNGEIVFQENLYSPHGDYRERFVTHSFYRTNNGGDVISVYSAQLNFAEIDGEMFEDVLIADVAITQVASFDENGELTSSLIQPKIIDLSQCVPDITVGEFFETLAQWRNFELGIRDGILFFNYIRDRIKPSNVVDLQEHLIRRPRKRHNTGRSWELLFNNPSDDVFEFPTLFFDIEGLSSDLSRSTNFTERIEINGIPLPQKTSNAITTAHLYFNDNEVLALSRYDGLTSNLNIAHTITGLSLANTFDSHYRDWLTFNLNTITYIWDFKCIRGRLQELTASSWIYAYGNIMLVRSFVKSIESQNVVNYEIEADLLK